MKTYVKPTIQFESFVLSQHIADCGWELQSANVESCYAKGDPDFGYPTDVQAFIKDEGVCKVQPEGYCWTAGSSNVGLFAS